MFTTLKKTLSRIQKRLCASQSSIKLAFSVTLSLSVLAFLISLVPDLNPAQVLAQGTPSQGILGGLGQGVGNAVAGVATLLFKLMAGIVNFVLLFMGQLMDNTFILEGDIGTKLRSVWVIVRNFVNIIFAMALVVIALMTVIGVGEENYDVRKFIPKMALALIVVNFTFAGCKVLLDLNNVLTTAIFSIPQRVTTFADVGTGGFGQQQIFKKFSCLDADIDKMTKLEQDLLKKYPGVIASLGGVCFALPYEGQNVANQPDKNGQEIVSLGAAGFSSKSFAWTMMTQFQGLHNLNKISQVLDPSFGGLTINALFSLLFAVIYGTAYIAMFIILVARVVVLWITIILSPIVAMQIAIPDILSDQFDIKKQFLDHAFVPAKMAVPLSFGFIMLSQMSQSIDTSDPIVTDGLLDLSQGGEFARGVKLTTLMYGAATVAVTWMGVFTAVGDVWGSELVGKIKDKVSEAGGSVSRWPLYAPIPMLGGLSLTGVGKAYNAFRDQEAQRRDRKDRDAMAKFLGIADTNLSTALENIKNNNRTREISDLTGDLRTVSNQSPQLFADQLDFLLKNLEPDRQRKLAQNLKFGSVADLKSTMKNNPSEVIKRVQAGSGVAADKPEMYTDIGKSQIAGNDKIQIDNEDLQTQINSDPDMKKLLGYNAKDKTIDVDRFSFGDFMSTLRDSKKVTADVFNKIIQSDTFKKLAENDAIKGKMKGDKLFLGRLKSQIDPNTTDTGQINLNQDIYKLYEKATTLKKPELEAALGIKENGTSAK